MSHFFKVYCLVSFYNKVNNLIDVRLWNCVNVFIISLTFLLTNRVCSLFFEENQRKWNFVAKISLYIDKKCFIVRKIFSYKKIPASFLIENQSSHKHFQWIVDKATTVEISETLLAQMVPQLIM